MSGIRALREELSAAPPVARREAAIGAAVASLVLIAAGWDLATGADGGEVLRWSVAMAGSIGLALHVVAQVIHRTGRVRSEAGRRAVADRFASPLLRETYTVLPAVGLSATTLLALAAGAEIVIATRHVRFWLAAGIFGFYAYRSATTVLGSARDLYGEATSHRDRAELAHSEATEARLRALQAQMNPHFLFNALNTVAALARTEPRAAERTTEALASVLRQTLRRSEDLVGTVEEEIEFVEAYLDVERQRWGERLTVVWDVDRRAHDAPLPPMTLQPLVENALLHGIGARLEGGTIRIAIAREDGTLVATVEDDGPGMEPGAEEGTGLGHLRERLETIYGNAASVEVASDREGTAVRIRVPTRLRTGLVDGVPDRTASVPCAS